LNSVQNRI